jgi:ubiquinone/menaquinone biosynthesis C-methylase UbiE
MKQPAYVKSDETIGRGLEAFNLRERLFRELRKRPKAKVLEIGCGKGKMILELLEKFPKLELHGVNLGPDHGLPSRAAFKKQAAIWNISIPKKATLPYIHFADAIQLPFKDNCFDVIASQVTFLHIKNKLRAIAEVCRTLKPNGMAFIAVGAYAIRLKSGHAMPAFYAKLRRMVGNDFNPRFIIKDGNKYLGFGEIVRRMAQRGFKFLIVTREFTSKTQRAKGFWIVIKKTGKGRVSFPFIYKPRESAALTKRYGKLNPVNWGAIDMYLIK